MNKLLKQIAQDKLVVISRGIQTPVLVQAAEACAQAGITLLESTFDHTIENPIEENAEKLRAIARAVGGKMRLGAGTVLTVEEVRAAYEAGAEYIISPGTGLKKSMAETKRLGMLSIPGAMAPVGSSAGMEAGCGYGQALSGG